MKSATTLDKGMTSSRNNRSKGINLKTILQIIMLVSICFLLIYQVKHSHDSEKDKDKEDGG